jgi:hypothetical protein
MVVAVWCLAVGVVTALTLAVVRVAYRRERNAEMPRAMTLVLVLLLVAVYATLARAVATG